MPGAKSRYVLCDYIEKKKKFAILYASSTLSPGHFLSIPATISGIISLWYWTNIFSHSALNCLTFPRGKVWVFVFNAYYIFRKHILYNSGYIASIFLENIKYWAIGEQGYEECRKFEIYRITGVFIGSAHSL